MAKTNDWILELCPSVLIDIAVVQIRHVAGSGVLAVVIASEIRWCDESYIGSRLSSHYLAS